MNGNKAVSRRDLLLKMGAATGFATLWLTGCSDDKTGSVRDGGNNPPDSGNPQNDSAVRNDSAVQGDSAVPGPDSAVQDSSVPVEAGQDAAVAPPNVACVNAPTISGHTGHSITIPLGHLTAIQERTYSIQGSSGHSHNVTISVSNFNALLAGSAVQVTSTGGGGGNHTHNLSWSNCD